MPSGILARTRENAGANRAALLAWAVSLVLCGLGCSPEPSELSVGSGGSLGGYAAAARSISRVVNAGSEQHGVRLRSVDTAGSVANIQGVLSGELAFGLAQGDIERQAVRGEGQWASTGPRGELRALFTLYTEAVTIIAPRYSGIVTTRDLIGKRVDIGHPESGVHRNAVDVLDALGIDWRDGMTVYQEEPGARADLYLAGSLDAFFQTVGHPTNDLLFAVNSQPGARLVAIDGIDHVLRDHPEYVRTTLRADLYEGLGNEADVVTVGVPTVVVTSASTPDETVAAVMNAVMGDLAGFGQFDPLLQELDRAAMARGMNAPLHPAAERYLRAAGLLSGS